MFNHTMKIIVHADSIFLIISMVIFCNRVPTFPDWQNSLTFPWLFQYFFPFSSIFLMFYFLKGMASTYYWVSEDLASKKSLTEIAFCDWVTAVWCFFPEAWLFTATSPMLDSENVLTHNLQFAFVESPSTDVSQSLYSSFDNHSLEFSRMCHFFQLLM